MRTSVFLGIILANFSKTAWAHELGVTHDWVVIYCDDTDGQAMSIPFLT